jgi:outer membrane protein OmpA-like peptidoglycan-associated protein
VEDALDKCPDVKGLPAFAGCPDTDRDGVQDAVDRCPTVAGLASEGGCPLLTKEDKKVIDTAVRNLQFETNSNQLTVGSLPVLDKVVQILLGYPNYTVRVNGHTDSVGKDKANLKLSQRRAQACVDYLIKKGIPAQRLTAQGFGERKPIASNKNAAGRAKNRRVEFELIKR